MDKIEIIQPRPKPIVLIVLDGWGINQPYQGNAITQARTPFMDYLISEYPSMTLRASGEAVGLPWGESGNSEVGHLNLGLGRILYQDLPRINKDISNGSFYQNPVLLSAIKHVKKYNSKLHLLGLTSNGCVHSSIDHLYALLVLAKKFNMEKVFIHAILDGRDTPFNGGLNFIKGVEKSIAENHVGKIASVIGRFYAMDRNNNWDRTKKAYLALTEGKGNKFSSAIEAIKNSYQKKIYDEEMLPIVISNDNGPIGLVEENDAIIFFNYRPDRARQITKAFAVPEFKGFERTKFLRNLFFVAFTEYEKGLPVKVAFPADIIKDTLGEVLANNNFKQLRIAETEKYAHVTYFFNGGKEKAMPGEDHLLVPSKPIASYDEIPEMSAPEITKKLMEKIEKDIYDFILVNYANADMVGHTGNLDAAIKAVETIDHCLEKIITLILSKNGLAMITADHGNAEVMFNMQTGQIDKEHTANPVPFILIAKPFAGRRFGWQDAVNNDLSTVQPQGILSDVAPTILKLMGIKQPKTMTGMSLI